MCETFYEWWMKERFDYLINPEFEDVEEAAERGYNQGYKQALRKHGLLGGECQDLLDHYRIPGTDYCCKCAFKFETVRNKEGEK